MLIHKLSQPIEANEEVLSEEVRTQLRSDPYLEHIQRLSDADLGVFVNGMLRCLALWADGQDEQLQTGTQFVGDVCLRQSVPLFEAAYGVYIIRDKLLDFLRRGRRSKEIDYDPEQELEQRVLRFFDLLVEGVLKAY